MNAQVIPLFTHPHATRAPSAHRAEARRLRAEGLSFDAIGEQLSISAEWARRLAGDVVGAKVVRQKPGPDAELKRCPRCDLDKRRDEFSVRNRRGRGDRQGYCRTCAATVRAEYRAKVLPRRLTLVPSPEIDHSVAECVCGHAEYFHPNGGACSCGACPEWFEKGL